MAGFLLQMTILMDETPTEFQAFGGQLSARPKCLGRCIYAVGDDGKVLQAWRSRGLDGPLVLGFMASMDGAHMV